MAGVHEFVKVVKSEFPDDRLTFQKNIPTFHPESADEAAAIFRLAGRLGQRVFITGFGNIIDPAGDRFDGLVTVRTDRLNRFLEFSEAGLYVKAGAGFPLMEINHELAPYEYFVPLSQLPYVGSVGGAVAVNLSADLHGVDLPARRFVLQLEVVTGGGEILTAGSPNLKVAGGQDIARVFASSWGLLGLIISVTFRVVPISALGDYSAIKMKEVARSSGLPAVWAGGGSADQDYFRKIKGRFDPAGVLPAV